MSSKIQAFPLRPFHKSSQNLDRKQTFTLLQVLLFLSGLCDKAVFCKAFLGKFYARFLNCHANMLWCSGSLRVKIVLKLNITSWNPFAKRASVYFTSLTYSRITLFRMKQLLVIYSIFVGLKAGFLGQTKSVFWYFCGNQKELLPGD